MSGDDDAVPCHSAASAALADAQLALADARKALGVDGLDGDEKIVAEGRVRELEVVEEVASAENALSKAREELRLSTGSDAVRATLTRVVSSAKSGLDEVRRRQAIEAQDRRVVDDVCMVLEAKDPT